MLPYQVTLCRETAASLYGFDTDVLNDAADRIGSTVGEVLHPGEIPTPEALGQNETSFLCRPGL